jgi:DNA-binding transcriptional MerR regulator
MQNCQKNLKIGDMAKLANLEVQTIRYYESIELLPEPKRTESGYRKYDEEYLEHLRFIKNSQELGFSLEEIKDLVKHKFSKKSLGKDVKDIIKTKINDIDQEIKELKELKLRLSKLDSSCSGKMKTACCPILNTLSVQ